MLEGEDEIILPFCEVLPLTKFNSTGNNLVAKNLK